MNYPQLTRRLVPVVLAVSMVLPGLSLQAQEMEFADDFSSDSIRFSVGSFNGPDGNFSVTPTADGLQLLTTTDTLDQPASVYFRAIDDSDSFAMDYSHSSSSSIDGGFANAFLQASFYSDTPNSSNRNGEGSVLASITFGYDISRQLGVFYCMGRKDANGDDMQVQGTCGQFELNPNFDQSYALNISLDRNANVLTFSVDDETKTFGIPETIYPSERNTRQIQLYLDGGTGAPSGTVHAVTLGDEVIDMAVNPPVYGRYIGNFEPGSTVEIVNSKVAVTANSFVEADRFTNAELYLQQPTDYLEAELVLSSASDISMPDYQAYAGLEANIYNTQADGGVDGRLGEVRANLNLEARGDGLRRAEICLQHYVDAQGDSRTGLLDPEDPDNRCSSLPLRIELDKAYRTSMSLDRAASTFTFRVGDISQTIPLDTSFFKSENPSARVSIASRNGGIAVGTIDNVRSAPAALTATEQASGATAPVPFPDPIDIATIQEDSTIAYPFDFFNYEPRLDFVDDFSGITSDFGFWSGRDRGGSGVSWSDGAVTLETSTAAGNDDGNWTEFYLDPKTDSLEAVVSMSSETLIPPGNSGAEISIRAIFYNDTQNYGFNDQEGDMEAALQLQFEGDGRRRMRVKLRRRDAGGSGGDNVLEGIAEFEEGLMAIVPEYDQQYKLSLAIDRENGSIRFGVDDQFTDYQITSGAFLPSRNRVLISVNHYRGSGVAVGLIHSVQTDNVDEDFSLGAPLLAPYRPTFNAQYPGRVVEAIDGRLRLEADGTLTSGRDPRIVALSGSDYLGADIELSSESVIASDGKVLVGISGAFYNDLTDGSLEQGNNEGQVFAAVRLTATGDGERFVQYCAFRSNDSDFSDVTELVGGDVENCPRFSFRPELDTAYPAFIKLDRAAATLTFGFNAETFVYNIPTSISNTPPFHGVRARTSDGSKVLAFADNLAFAENPVALADSANGLVADVSTDNNGNTEPTDNSGNTDGAQQPESSSGGGGAIGPGMFILLLLAGIAGLLKRQISFLRTISDRRILRASIPCLCFALLFGCATSSVSPQAENADLSSAEVILHISGKTETWSSGAAYYAADGTIEVVWEGKSGSGTWQVADDGNVCFIASVLSPDEECHSYRLKGGVVHLVYNDNLSQRDVIEGNQLDSFR